LEHLIFNEMYKLLFHYPKNTMKLPRTAKNSAKILRGVIDSWSISAAKRKTKRVLVWFRADAIDALAYFIPASQINIAKYAPRKEPLNI